MTPTVDSFFDPKTNSLSYIVSDSATGHAAVVDPVLDFDPVAGRTWTESADRLIAAVERGGFSVDWILETHVHADHISAAPYVQGRIGGRTGIGAGVAEVQKTFGSLFNIERDLAADGSQFDRLFADGDTLAIGDIVGRVVHTPGHTPACACYVFGDAAFVGDTAVHARFRHRAGGFPRRLRGRALRVALPDPLFAAGDEAVHVPRLRRRRRARLRLGDHRRGTAAQQHPLPRRGEP